MFFILFILVLLIIIVLNSKLQLKICNFDISTERTKKVKDNFEIYLEIIIFNKLKIFKFNLKKFKNRNIDIKMLLNKVKQFEQKNINKQFIIETIKNLKNLQLQIISADLKVELGTEDSATTAILIGIIASILGVILKGYKFETIPIYREKNILNVRLNCIIRLNLIHYIYKTISKGREKNERKSSYRRSYAYSNE